MSVIRQEGLSHFWSTDDIECFWCHRKRTAEEIQAWVAAGKPDEICRPITSARQAIQQKTVQVQKLIHIWMTTESVKYGAAAETEAELEQLAHNALAWWSKLYLDATALTPMSEAEFAEKCIERIRRQEVWGKILRGDAN